MGIFANRLIWLDFRLAGGHARTFGISHRVTTNCKGLPKNLGTLNCLGFWNPVQIILAGSLDQKPFWMVFPMDRSLQGTISVVVPAKLIVMAPPTAQLQMEVLFKAGMPRTSTVGLPGAQGATVAGTQGVGTPDAAAVKMLQVPNGTMLTVGT